MWKHESHFGQTFDLILGIKNPDFMDIDWWPLAVLQASPQNIPAGLLGNLSVFHKAFFWSWSQALCTLQSLLEAFLSLVQKVVQLNRGCAHVVSPPWWVKWTVCHPSSCCETWLSKGAHPATASTRVIAWSCPFHLAQEVADVLLVNRSCLGHRNHPPKAWRLLGKLWFNCHSSSCLWQLSWQLLSPQPG